MKVNIKKIAELANVSIGTVDRALHNRPGVSPEKKEEIERIAKEHSYKPNIAAKALAFQKKPTTIGVIVYEHYQPYAAHIMEGIKAAEKELRDFGVVIEILRMENQLVSEQIELLDQLIQKGVSGIMVRPMDDPCLRDKINEATDLAIPVVTYNSDIDDSKRLCFVGQDLVKSGQVAAELLGKMMNKNGKVAIFTGHFKVKAHNERIKGFVEVITNEYPKIEIVETVETLEDSEITYTKVKEVFEKHKDLKAIYATAGCFKEMGEAIKLMDRENKIAFAGYDFYPEVIELVKEGVMDFTIGQNLFAQGYEPIMIIFDLIFKNKKPSKEQLFTNLDIRVKWNIE